MHATNYSHHALPPLVPSPFHHSLFSLFVRSIFSLSLLTFSLFLSSLYIHLHPSPTIHPTPPNHHHHTQKMPDSDPPSDTEHNAEPDVHFEPVIKLETKVAVKTWEEDEEVIFKMYFLPLLLPLLCFFSSRKKQNADIKTSRRAKLFRFDTDATEWKERGTGDVRLLQHNENKKVRLVMRRDKTHKVCANHIGKALSSAITTGKSCASTLCS